MKKILATLVITLAFVVPMGAVGASTALAAKPASHAAKVTASRAHQSSCPSYSTTCIQVTVTGPINTTCGVLNIGNSLTGNAQLNTTVECAAIAQVVQTNCPAQSFVIHGSGLDMHARSGQLFQFNPNTGTSVAVAAITQSGIFSLVAANCAASVGGEITSSVPSSVLTSVLPITGGGQPSGPSLPLLPLGLGALLVLTGAAVAFRNRVTQV